jgi:gas vesicle protein GvpL/GvpF
MNNVEKALYLFCFARSDRVGELQGNGVDTIFPLSVFRHFPDVCAVVGQVAREDFCDDTAESRLRDLAWVGPRALSHEAVVEEVMRSSPVFPARFGTLFSALASLAGFMDKHRGTISQFLERVEHQDEWALKCRLDRKRAGRALVALRVDSQQEQIRKLSAGARYFENQRIRARAEKELDLWLNQTLRQVAGDLIRQASEFRECPVVDWGIQEDGSEAIVNWALLLPRNKTAAVRGRTEQLNRDFAPSGLAFELSGPWPPYRFAPVLPPEASL